MKIFTFISKLILYFLLVCYFKFKATSQSDSTQFFQKIVMDTIGTKLNMDAVYNRPFLTVAKSPIAIGGYVEANTEYAATDGVSSGFSFQARRLTLFLSSTIGKKLKFFSELEFEDGVREINIEFAAMDIEFHPLLNLRAGILMNPIGGFNQNHDGPRWDFIDRPISAIQIIPSTLSNVGFGLHGKYYLNRWVFGYETYITNGFDDQIISNNLNRTSLAAGKDNPDRFVKSNSGLPMFSGKIAVRNRKIGEMGLSFMTGVYNRWKKDGLILDVKRSASIFAVDFTTSLFNQRIDLVGEFAKLWVDVPDSYSETFGSIQYGGFVDMLATIYRKPILGWEKAKIVLGVRLEYSDFNQGKFKETNGNIGDHIWAIVPTISFRPVGNTVLRFNYRYHQKTDLLANPSTHTGIIQVGFSSYF